MTEKIDAVIGGGGGGSFDGDVVFDTWTPTLGIAVANFTIAASGASISPDGYGFGVGATGGWCLTDDLPFDATLRGHGLTFDVMPVGDTTDSVGLGLTTFTAAGLDPNPPTGGGLVLLFNEYDSTLQRFDSIQAGNPFVGDLTPFVATPTILAGDKLFFAFVDNGDDTADISLYVNGLLIETVTTNSGIASLPTAPLNFGIIAQSTYNWTGNLITNPADVPAGVTQYEVTGGINNYPIGRENKIFEVTGLGVSTVQTDSGLLLFDELLVLFNGAGNIADIPKMGQHLTQAQADQLYQPKFNTVENSFAPTVNDDFSQGYTVFDRWIDTSVSPREAYTLTNSTIGAAVWENTTFNSGDVGSMAFQNTANYYQTVDVYTKTEVNNLITDPVPEYKTTQFTIENGKRYAVNPGVAIVLSLPARVSGVPFYTEITLAKGFPVTFQQNIQQSGGSGSSNFFIQGIDTGSNTFTLQPGLTYGFFFDGVSGWEIIADGLYPTVTTGSINVFFTRGTVRSTNTAPATIGLNVSGSIYYPAPKIGDEITVINAGNFNVTMNPLGPSFGINPGVLTPGQMAVYKYFINGSGQPGWVSATYPSIGGGP